MSLDRFNQTDTETSVASPSGGQISLYTSKAYLGSGQVTTTTATALSTASNQTYTVAQLGGGILARDPNGGARTDVTPTAALMIAGSPNVFPALTNDGDTFTCILINTADAAEAITLSAGTGVTIANAGQTLAQNESALLVFRRTSATTVTLYIIGA